MQFLQGESLLHTGTFVTLTEEVERGKGKSGELI